MTKTLKKITIFTVMLSILILPNFVKATTIEELQARITELTNMIQELQEQLAQIQGVSSQYAGYKEYFIKLSNDRQTLYLQDKYANPRLNDINITLINTNQLNGHAKNKFDDATILYDKKNSIYKMWAVASTGPYGYWSVYYLESDSLFNWNIKKIQELYYGKSDKWDISRQKSISVLRNADATYEMWFSNYQANGWKEQIWHLSSVDGISWIDRELIISAVSLDDWRYPTALHLRNGNYRLYYDHYEGDVYDFLYLYKTDVGVYDAITSNQFAKIHMGSSILSATIIGNQNGDNHHRVWATRNSYLLKFDSFNEGQIWTETNIGTYDSSQYTIVGTFYDIP